MLKYAYAVFFIGKLPTTSLCCRIIFYFCELFHESLLLQNIETKYMYWTLELASKLEDAPWPASKEELVDFAQRSGAPLEVIENLQEIEDEGEVYESIEDIWPDYPSKEDFFFNEEEY
jgi:hypothetical protein